MNWTVNLRATNRKSSDATTTTLPAQKTEIIINVYDLLPPGRLSSTLWVLGTPLLHSGVVIRDKEYAYGGHEHRGVSGVYWTTPRTEPPGGRFRSEVLHGFTSQTDDEINNIIQEVSEEFQGTSYNLLMRNCNHFTHALCRRLTSRSAPKWLNRAASIGVALPCVLPREWIAPPDHETADGQLVDDSENDERTVMLRPRRSREQEHSPSQANKNTNGTNGASAPRTKGWRRHPDRNAERRNSHPMVRDTSGRVMPACERAPEP